jgi:hypothetical protein
MPVIPAIWETEIGRIAIPGQPRQMVCESPIFKVTRTKWTEGVVQRVGRPALQAWSPEFKTPVPLKKRKKKQRRRKGGGSVSSRRMPT